MLMADKWTYGTRLIYPVDFLFPAECAHTDPTSVLLPPEPTLSDKPSSMFIRLCFTSSSPPV